MVAVDAVITTPREDIRQKTADASGADEAPRCDPQTATPSRIRYKSLPILAQVRDPHSNAASKATAEQILTELTTGKLTALDTRLKNESFYQSNAIRKDLAILGSGQQNADITKKYINEKRFPILLYSNVENYARNIDKYASFDNKIDYIKSLAEDISDKRSGDYGNRASVAIATVLGGLEGAEFDAGVKALGKNDTERYGRLRDIILYSNTQVPLGTVNYLSANVLHATVTSQNTATKAFALKAGTELYNLTHEKWNVDNQVLTFPIRRLFNSDVLGMTQQLKDTSGVDALATVLNIKLNEKDGLDDARADIDTLIFGTIDRAGLTVKDAQNYLGVRNNKAPYDYPNMDKVIFYIEALGMAVKEDDAKSWWRNSTENDFLEEAKKRANPYDSWDSRYSVLERNLFLIGHSFEDD